MKGRTMDRDHIQTAVNLLLKDGDETRALVRDLIARNAEDTRALVRDLLAQHGAAREKLTSDLLDLQKFEDQVARAQPTQ